MKPLVITAGEPAGIGPDCILRAYDSQQEMLKHSLIAAPASWLQARAATIGMQVPMQEYTDWHEASLAAAANATGLCCWNPLDSQQTGPVMAGQPASHTAASVVCCIEAAARACLSEQAAAMVTGPIEKAVLRSAGFTFPGHTEFLAYLAAQHTLSQAKTSFSEAGAEDQSHFVMMLASEHMRVALLTTHLAIRDVPDALGVDETLKCMQIVEHDLRSRFGIITPRLALCALNPHAGEQGHFGREEIDILAPAAAQARRSQGIQVTDPLPADTVFSAAVRSQYDAMICCYHDQALIPLKTLSFGEAVNVTLGLPFIRTSVDHGTALDRVGQSSVSCSSLLAAITMARQMGDLTR